MAYHVKNTPRVVEFLKQLGFVPYSAGTIKDYCHFRVRFDENIYSGANIHRRHTDIEVHSLDTLKELSIMPNDEVRDIYLESIQEGRQ